MDWEGREALQRRESKDQYPSDPESTNRCDFCNAPDAETLYKADPFVIKFQSPREVRVRYGSNWWACDMCADLIDADDRDALLERSVQGNVPSPSLNLTQRRSSLREIADGFFANRRKDGR